MQSPGYSRPRVWAFLAVEVLLALALLVTQVPQLDGPIVVLMILLGLEILSEFYPIEIYGDTYISIGDAVMAATIILLGRSGRRPPRTGIGHRFGDFGQESVAVAAAQRGDVHHRLCRGRCYLHCHCAEYAPTSSS